jgi:hypothetical protein
MAVRTERAESLAQTAAEHSARELKAGTSQQKLVV